LSGRTKNLLGLVAGRTAGRWLRAYPRIRLGENGEAGEAVAAERRSGIAQLETNALGTAQSHTSQTRRARRQGCGTAGASRDARGIGAAGEGDDGRQGPKRNPGQRSPRLEARERSPHHRRFVFNAEGSVDGTSPAPELPLQSCAVAPKIVTRPRAMTLWKCLP
jgi:hypothetical protein